VSVERSLKRSTMDAVERLFASMQSEARAEEERMIGAVRVLHDAAARIGALELDFVAARNVWAACLDPAARRYPRDLGSLPRRDRDAIVPFSRLVLGSLRNAQRGRGETPHPDTL
jgi:hypothetical protein